MTATLKRVDIHRAARAFVDGLWKGPRVVAEITNNDGFNGRGNPPAFVLHLWRGRRLIDGKTRPHDAVAVLDADGWRITEGVAQGLHGAWTVEVDYLPTATNAEVAGRALADILVNIYGEVK